MAGGPTQIELAVAPVGRDLNSVSAAAIAACLGRGCASACWNHRTREKGLRRSGEAAQPRTTFLRLFQPLTLCFLFC